MITVITMYRGYDAEMFVQAVEGTLSEEMRRKWRKAHLCDQYCPNSPVPPGKAHDDDNCDDHNCMFFQELDVKDSSTTHDLKNVDGEYYGGKE